MAPPSFPPFLGTAPIAWKPATGSPEGLTYANVAQDVQTTLNFAPNAPQKITKINTKSTPEGHQKDHLGEHPEAAPKQVVPCSPEGIHIANNVNLYRGRRHGEATKYEVLLLCTYLQSPTRGTPGPKDPFKPTRHVGIRSVESVRSHRWVQFPCLSSL